MTLRGFCKNGGYGRYRRSCALFRSGLFGLPEFTVRFPLTFRHVGILQYCSVCRRASSRQRPDHLCSCRPIMCCSSHHSNCANLGMIAAAAGTVRTRLLHPFSSPGTGISTTLTSSWSSSSSSRMRSGFSDAITVSVSSVFAGSSESSFAASSSAATTGAG